MSTTYSFSTGSCCTYPMRFMSLISIAILGTAIVIVLMSVPAVRNVITYKETTCTILNKTLETELFGKVYETRPLFNVSYVPRYDSTETNVSCAFRSPVFSEFYVVNQSSWLSQYEIGKTYKCFYSAELQLPPTCSPTAVVFEIPYRNLVIAMIAISAVSMLSVPVVVLVITLHRESHVEAIGNKALFTPQNPAPRSEVDQLLPSRVKHPGHIQARYSTDEEKAH